MTIRFAPDCFYLDQNNNNNNIYFGRGNCHEKYNKKLGKANITS